jgi:hypothetical protein
MTPPQSGTNPPVNPFIGPVPFTRGETIYGRQTETNRLANMLVAQRVVLLYSPSGAGKTSLVRAGLVPRLEAKRFRVLPDIRVNRKAVPDGPVTNRYLRSALASFTAPEPEAGDPPPGLSQGPPPATLEGVIGAAAGGSGSDRRDLVLFFDQLEEVLTADPTDQEAKHEFFATVGALLRTGQVWAIFAIREDFLAGLDPYLHHISDRLSTRFRLDLLRADAAREAILQPDESGTPRVSFTPRAVDLLLTELQTVWVQRAVGGPVKQPGPFVEPVQLQVVCRRLWESRRPGTTEINEDDVTRQGGVESALGDYYEKTVEDAAKTAGSGGRRVLMERQLRDWIDRRLITRGQLRAQAAESELGDDGPSLGAIGVLVKGHLVRREENVRGATWYELSHDRLVAPIQARNKLWREGDKDRKANLQPFQRRADVWNASDRPTGLLLRGAELAEAESWAAGRDDQLSRSDQDFLRESREYRDRRDRQAVDLGTNLADLGWGVIFADGADPAVRAALAPLLDLRKSQATLERVKLYRDFSGESAYRLGETAQQFLVGRGAAAGLADWGKVPFYLLLVGGPETIPFEFQYDLSARHAVGRIHFDTLAEYDSYARSVVAAETGRVALPRRAVVFAPVPQHHQPSEVLDRSFIESLLERLDQDQPNWDVLPVRKAKAVKARLARLLGGDETPAFFFAAGQAAFFKLGHPLQATDQGAIVCQDWSGLGAPSAEHYFSAADVSDDARLLGLIAFLFSPSGAGTSASRDFSLGPEMGGTRADAPAARPFLARLARRLLGHPLGGALAVIGHVDQTWAYSFMTPDLRRDPNDLVMTQLRLLQGSTVGTALRFLVARQVRLASELESELRAVTFCDKIRDDPRLGGLLNAFLDARNYVILGDPAVRIPLGAGTGDLKRPTLDPPTVTASAVSGLTTGSAPDGSDAAGSAGAVAPLPDVGTLEVTTLMANGIDGDTGNYLLPPLPTRLIAYLVTNWAGDPATKRARHDLINKITRFYS